MRLLEALMKAIWGTDTEATQHRAESDQLLSDAEAKVDRFRSVIKNIQDRPARNLDEALYQVSNQGRENGGA